MNDSLGDLVFERDENDSIDRKCKACDKGELSLKNSFRGALLLDALIIQNVNLQDLYQNQKHHNKLI